MQTLKKLFRQLFFLVPTRLPQGMTEFDAYVDSIISTYDMPTADRDSVSYVIAATMMRFDPTTAYKSKVYFGLLLKAAAAKQIAGAKFADIRERQKAAELAAQQAAVTAQANPQVQAVTNGVPALQA